MPTIRDMLRPNCSRTHLTLRFHASHRSIPGGGSARISWSWGALALAVWFQVSCTPAKEAVPPPRGARDVLDHKSPTTAAGAGPSTEGSDHDSAEEDPPQGAGTSAGPEAVSPSHGRIAPPDSGSPCKEPSDCRYCTAPNGIHSPADCQCVGCPDQVASVEECRRREARYRRFCSGYEAQQRCPKVKCAKPPNAGCIDGRCQASLDL